MERAGISEGEYERTIARYGVDLELCQRSAGAFRATLGALDVNGTVLYFGDHNESFMTCVTSPAQSVSLITAVSPHGATAAEGRHIERDGVCLLPPGRGADLVAPREVASVSLTIPLQRFHELAAAVSPGLRSFERVELVRGDAERLSRLRRTTRALVQQSPAHTEHEALDNLVAEWLAWLGHSEADREHSVLRERQAQVARQARSYFADHYTEDVRMEDVCRELGMGLRNLQRCFADQYQMSPRSYLKTLRLNRAHRALRALDPDTASVTRIAMDNGYCHVGRFSVEYRAMFGERPRETLAARRAKCVDTHQIESRRLLISR